MRSSQPRPDSTALPLENDPVRIEPVFELRQANSYVDDSQERPAVATLADGGFVIVWESLSQDAAPTVGVFGQRFDANGTLVGEEFIANTTTVRDQRDPAVAGLADGGFIVVWENAFEAPWVRGQLYDAAGRRVGGELLLTDDQANYERSALVGLDDGGFFLAYISSSDGLIGRRFDASGTPMGEEILIADTFANYTPTVTVLADGGLVVVFESLAGDDAIAQRFDANAVPIGEQITVSAIDDGELRDRSVAGLADGSFVVSWQVRNSFSDDGIYAQRFDADGLPTGEQIRIDEIVDDNDNSPEVVALDDGGFVIGWNDGQAYFTQQFDASGARVGEPLELTADGSNSFEGGIALAALPNNGYLAAFETFGTGSDDSRGISYLVLGDPEGYAVQQAPELSPLSTPLVFQEASVNDSAQLLFTDGSVSLTDADSADFQGGLLRLTYLTTELTLDREFGATDGSAQDQLGVRNQGIGEGEIGVDGNSISFGGVTFASVVRDGSDGSPLVIAFNGNADAPAIQALVANLTYANRSDDPTASRLVRLEVLDGDGAASTPQVLDIRVTAQGDGNVAAVEEGQVNTFASGDQGSASVAALSDGGYVVIWFSDEQSSGSPMGQRFDADGVLRGPEFLIGDATQRALNSTSVTGLDDGGFLVTWTAEEGVFPVLIARRYDSEGNPVTDDGRLTLTTAQGAEQTLQVIELADGSLASLWAPVAFAFSDTVLFQRHDAALEPIGETITLDAQPTMGLQALGLADGGFLLTWNDDDGDSSGVFARRYDDQGNAIGEPIQVNEQTRSVQSDGLGAQLIDGTVVVTWLSATDQTDDSDVYARRFDAELTPLGEEFRVNATIEGDQLPEGITALANGGFAISYGGGFFGDAIIFVQQFDALGRRIDGEIQVSQASALDAEASAIAGLADGSFVVTLEWFSIGNDGDGDGSGTGIFQSLFADPDSFTAQQAPTLTGFSPAGPFDEALVNETPQLLDADGDVSLSDVDSTDFDGGFLAITPVFTGEFVDSFTPPDDRNQDQLNVRSVGNGVGEINVLDNLVLFGGTAFGTLAQTGPQLRVDFNANASAEAVEALIENVTYANISDAPAPSRRLRLEVSDGDGANSVPELFDVQVTEDIDGLQPLLVEDLVNTFTNASQEFPAALALSDGGYLLAYSSRGTGYLAQRFDANGTQVGSEVLLSNVSSSNLFQNTAAIALEQGSYLLGWTGSDADDTGVFIQAFDARSNPITDALQINSSTMGDQENLDLAMLSNGELIAVWDSDDQDGDEKGIFGRRLDTDGNLLGAEFQINTEFADNQRRPVVAALGDGGFAVVWVSRDQDGSDDGIFGQRFDSLGNPLGGEFQVNTGSSEFQLDPSIAAIADGGFIVTWQSDNSLDTRRGVYAQRFDADGQPVAGEFQVNDAGAAEKPEVIALANGGWIVTWQGEGFDDTIFAQQYDSEGRRIDGSVRLNAGERDRVTDPVLAELADGTVVFAFTTDSGNEAGDGDGDDNSVLQTLLGDADSFPAFAAPQLTDFSTTISYEESDVNRVPRLLDEDAQITLTDVDTTTFEGGSVLVTRQFMPPTISAQFNPPDDSTQDQLGIRHQGTEAGQIGLIGTAVTFAGAAIGDVVSDGANGRALEVALNGNATREAVEALVENLTYANASSDPAPTRTFTVQVSDDQGRYSEPVTIDVNVQGSIDALPALAEEQQVNSRGFNDQDHPTITQLLDGTVVVAFESTVQQGTIRGQRFDTDGTPLGEEFQLNTTTMFAQSRPSLSATQDGGFVAVWDSDRSDGSEEGIVGQRFDAQGNVTGTEFLVNTSVAGRQTQASVGGLADGGFLVTWYSTNDGGNAFARVFNADGSPRTDEFMANDTPSASPPRLATFDDSSFLIAWGDRDDDIGGVFAQRFDSNGVRIGNSVRLNQDTEDDQSFADIAALADGSFVAVWEDDFSAGYARIFDTDGQAISGDFQVTPPGGVEVLRIDALAFGGFAITWNDGDEIFLQQFDALGQRLDGATVVNTQTAGNQDQPAIVGTADGGVWVAWTSDANGEAGDGDDNGVFLRRFGNATPATDAIALDDAQEDQPIAIDVQVLNDAFMDDDGHALERIVIETLPANGELVLGEQSVAAGTEISVGQLQARGLSYLPNADFNGNDSFLWRGGDRFDLSAPALADIIVAPVNDMPLAVDDQAATDEATPVSGNVLLNDSDVDGDALTIDGAGSFLSANGASVTLEENGNFVYDPGDVFVDLEQGDLVLDSFEYTVTDGNGAFATAEVSVQVSGTSDEPAVIRIGDAPAQITLETLDAWREAWTDPGVVAAHRSNLLDGDEPWTDLLYLPFARQALAGGDGFRGDVGVSGQTLATSSVAQEIDGTEALRFRLVEDATQVTFGLSRLFPNDDGQGRDEAGRVQLYNRAGELLAEEYFVASAGNGTLEVTVSADAPFAQVVFTAGFQLDDEFVFGGYSPDGNTGTEQAPTGSDYLLDYVEFELLAGGNEREIVRTVEDDDAAVYPLGLLGVSMDGYEPELG